MLPSHADGPRTSWARIALAAHRLPEHTLGEAIGRHPRQQLTWLGLLSLPLLSPVSLPGMGTTVALFCLLVAASLLLGRPLPLPRWLQQRQLPPRLGEVMGRMLTVVCRRLARISRPRWLRLSSPSWRLANGLLLALAGGSMLVPVPMTSIDNIVPALAVLLLAWGLRVRDGALLLAGYVTTVLAWGYVALMWWAGAAILQWLASHSGWLG